MAIEFLSTPSARRATVLVPLHGSTQSISIHALREEGDGGPAGGFGGTGISIHALREEGDPPWGRWIRAKTNYFYPRPPRGGRPAAAQGAGHHRDFYPRPPRGGRLLQTGLSSISNRFLSTPSARRATDNLALLKGVTRISIHALREEGDECGVGKYVEIAKFLSTPSARRATAKTETKSLFSYKLYNILHEFRRALIYNGSKSYPNHAK